MTSDNMTNGTFNIKLRGKHLQNFFWVKKTDIGRIKCMV